MEFSKKVKRLRKDRKMTQKQLGIIAGVSNIQIGRYENAKAKPNKNTLHKLSKALEVSADYLENDTNLGPNNDLDEKYFRLKSVISKAEDITFLENFLDSFYELLCSKAK